MNFLYKKKKFFNRIKLYYYAFTTNAIFYKLMRLVFVILENIFYQNIILYKNFMRICLTVTKFII